MAVPAGSSTGEVDGGEAAWSTREAEAAASTRTAGRRSEEEEAAAAAGRQAWRPTAPHRGETLPGAPGVGRGAPGAGQRAPRVVPSLASGGGDGEQGVVSRRNHLLTEAPSL